jgi:hypothetical protein
MNAELILQPVAAMMLLTFVVWLRLYFVRVPEVTRRKVHPQKLATRAQKNAVDLGEAEARTSDNFQNLFELPVVFYILCLVIYAGGFGDAIYVILAWLFAVSRIAHSVIHLFYNNVLHRLAAYIAGGAALFAMVLRFAYSVF